MNEIPDRTVLAMRKLRDAADGVIEVNNNERESAGFVDPVAGLAEKHVREALACWGKRMKV